MGKPAIEAKAIPVDPEQQAANDAAQLAANVAALKQNYENAKKQIGEAQADKLFPEFALEREQDGIKPPDEPIKKTNKKKSAKRAGKDKETRITKAPVKPSAQKPTTGKVWVSFQLTHEEKDSLVKHAEESERNLSQFLRYSLKNFIGD